MHKECKEKAFLSSKVRQVQLQDIFENVSFKYFSVSDCSNSNRKLRTLSKILVVQNVGKSVDDAEKLLNSWMKKFPLIRTKSLVPPKFPRCCGLFSLATWVRSIPQALPAGQPQIISAPLLSLRWVVLSSRWLLRSPPVIEALLACRAQPRHPRETALHSDPSSRDFLPPLHACLGHLLPNLPKSCRLSMFWIRCCGCCWCSGHG